MNEEYTIVIGLNGVTVLDGKVKGARGGWQAPGIDIYVRGRVTKERMNDVHYHAMAICQRAYIPLIKLVEVGRIVKKMKEQNTTINPAQMEMFPDE